MSYVECPQCGHKALSVATRCPRCGHDLPPHHLRRPEPKPERPRLRPALLVAAAVLAGIVVVLASRQGAGSKAVSAPPAAASRDTAAPSEPQPSLPQPAAAADSSRSVAPPGPAAPAAPASVLPPPSGQAVQRYARTWVNVREGRGRYTAPVRVLNPGERVRVDSLQRGWYRVLVNGRAQGYVHRSQLDAVPPPTAP